MGGMDLWVSYPTAFKVLDAWINDPTRTAAQYQKLATDFATQGPVSSGAQQIPLTPGWSAHFDQHWIGQMGTKGGEYWPYIDLLDVRRMLRCAFEESVRLLVQAREALARDGKTVESKQHATLWMCSAPMLKDTAGTPLPPGSLTNVDDQAAIFRVAVLDLPTVVTVVISTPEPNPALCGPSGEKVVYPYEMHPARHWRVLPEVKGYLCSWAQVFDFDKALADPGDGAFGSPIPATQIVPSHPLVEGKYKLKTENRNFVAAENFDPDDPFGLRR